MDRSSSQSSIAKEESVQSSGSLAKQRESCAARDKDVQDIRNLGLVRSNASIRGMCEKQGGGMLEV